LARSSQSIRNEVLLEFRAEEVHGRGLLLKLSGIRNYKIGGQARLKIDAERFKLGVLRCAPARNGRKAETKYF